MDFECEKLGKEYYHNLKDFKESDICDYCWIKEGDYCHQVSIETWKNSNQRVKIDYLFKDLQAFRYLSEMDLAGYWGFQDFRNGYHLYKITKGGWLSEDILANRNTFNKELKEYFIATSNWSMTILSYEDPIITETDIDKSLIFI